MVLLKNCYAKSDHFYFINLVIPSQYYFVINMANTQVLYYTLKLRIGNFCCLALSLSGFVLYFLYLCMIRIYNQAIIGYAHKHVLVLIFQLMYPYLLSIRNKRVGGISHILLFSIPSIFCRHAKNLRRSNYTVFMSEYKAGSKTVYPGCNQVKRAILRETIFLLPTPYLL